MDTYSQIDSTKEGFQDYSLGGNIKEIHDQTISKFRISNYLFNYYCNSRAYSSCYTR